MFVKICQYPLYIFWKLHSLSAVSFIISAFFPHFHPIKFVFAYLRYTKKSYYNANTIDFCIKNRNENKFIPTWWRNKDKNKYTFARAKVYLSNGGEGGI